MILSDTGTDGESVQSDPVMDEALGWFFRLQAEPDNTHLRAQFAVWRDADAAHGRAYSTVASAWDLPEMDMVAQDYIDIVPHRATVRRKWGWGFGVAASIFLAIGIVQYPYLRVQWQADYQTVAGAQQVITLPDGSRMALNTASAVSLDFGEGKRSVTLLQGEAFFDVIPDPAHPFTVAAAFSEIEVKGTAFSVRTGSEGDTVILDHGRVAVTRLSQPTDMVTMTSGEATTITRNTLGTPTAIDPAQSLAWLGGQIVFEDEPLSHVIDELGRYYGHSIVVVNGDVGQVRVNGSYRLNDPERIIRSLAMAAGGEVTRFPGGILILR